MGGIMGFYSRLDDIIRNEPLEKDKAFTDQFKVIGIGTDEPFNPKKLSQPILTGLAAGAKDAEQVVKYAAQNSAVVSGGWNLELNGGRYGTDFLARAAINLNSIGLNTPERAMYPKRFVDADGNQLQGFERYEITIPANSLVRKEVAGFWSITMYDAQNRFMVKNPINRYSIGDRTTGIQKNSDGSLTIYISNSKPADTKRMANWLPAPEGEFMLQYRLFEPVKEVYSGKVTLSQLYKVK